MTTRPKSSRQVKQKQRRERLNKKYSRNLAVLLKTGIYKPKSDILSPYRKWRINKAVKEYGEYLDPKEYLFVEALPASRRRAEELSMKTTPKGIFVERKGFKRAKLTKSKDREDEYQILLEGKVKRGERAGKRMTEIIPLASLDELMIETDRLRRDAESFGKLGKNEYIAFYIEDNQGESASWNVYDSPERLMYTLSTRYERSDASRIYLFRHIRIVKTENGAWFRQHPTFERTARRRRAKRRRESRGGAR